MKLSELVARLDYRIVSGPTTLDSIEIGELIYDTRKVSADCFFVCIQGTVYDAHDAIEEILAKGARAVAIEHEIDAQIMADHPEVVFLACKNNRLTLAITAAAYFGYPAEKLTTIGITGTKGKTTTSFMLREILHRAGFSTGLIGTIGAWINEEKTKTANTTPESYELQRLFAEMVKAGCTHCIMEVSSQGLKMSRVAGFTFDVGVFTNFSADHIGPNEHESMEEYLYCKSLLFRQCKHGFVNTDDASALGAVKDHTCALSAYGLEYESPALQDSSFAGKEICIAENITYTNADGILGMGFDAISSTGEMTHIATNVPGRFSVYNALAAFNVAKYLGIDTSVILSALSDVHVRGRVEMVPVSDRFTVMIDYAHNEASVESLLTTILAYHPKRIVCVYGGGGNRSKLRRYAMGELCGKMADLSILTADNPRDEEIASINEDIKVGLSKSNGRYIEIEDRKEAILYSIEHAEDGDIIILLGKGHEDYQEIKGVKYHFSEREVLEEYIATKQKASV